MRRAPCCMRGASHMRRRRRERSGAGFLQRWRSEERALPKGQTLLIKRAQRGARARKRRGLPVVFGNGRERVHEGERRAMERVLRSLWPHLRGGSWKNDYLNRLAFAERQVAERHDA